MARCVPIIMITARLDSPRSRTRYQGSSSRPLAGSSAGLLHTASRDQTAAASLAGPQCGGHRRGPGRRPSGRPDRRSFRLCRRHSGLHRWLRDLRDRTACALAPASGVPSRRNRDRLRRDRRVHHGRPALARQAARQRIRRPRTRPGNRRPRLIGRGWPAVGRRLARRRFRLRRLLDGGRTANCSVLRRPGHGQKRARSRPEVPARPGAGPIVLRIN